MSGTYSKVYLQIIFAVKRRENLIQKSWREELHKYISGIISAKSHKSIIVNGVADHVHCFVGFKPAHSISDLVRDIKNNSSKFINEHRFVKGKFEWQSGYGVFSYSESDIENVYQYIMNQEAHHKITSFKEEYESLLKSYNVEYNAEYLFEFFE